MRGRCRRATGTGPVLASSASSSRAREPGSRTSPYEQESSGSLRTTRRCAAPGPDRTADQRLGARSVGLRVVDTTNDARHAEDRTLLTGQQVEVADVLPTAFVGHEGDRGNAAGPTEDSNSRTSPIVLVSTGSATWLLSTVHPQASEVSLLCANLRPATPSGQKIPGSYFSR